MPTKLPTRDELEAAIAERGYSPEEAQATRIDWQRRVFAENQSAAEARYPGVKEKAGGVLSTLMNYGEGLLPGAASTMAAAITAPITAIGKPTTVGEEFQLNKDRADQILGANPTAATIGRVAAVISPNSPANQIASEGFRLAGGARLAASAAADASLAKASAKQISSALVGGAGAIVGLNATEGLFDMASGKRSLGDVFFDTIAQATSPTNLTLSAALGGTGALARVVADPGTRALVEKARRIIPGFKPTPDMLRSEGGWISSLIDSLSKSAAGRAATSEWMHQNFYTPMREQIGVLRRSFGVETRADAARATEYGAQTARALLPTVDDIGTLARKRQQIGRNIGNATETLGPGPLRPIVSVIDRLDDFASRRMQSDGPNSTEFSAMKQELRDVLSRVDEQIELPNHWRADTGENGFRVSGTPAPVQVLENWRQRLGEVARYENSTAGGARSLAENFRQRDAREAKILYRVVRETERKVSPTIDTALSDIHDLRSAERSLSQVANTANLGTDLDVARQIFTAPNFQRRWTTLEQQLPRDRVEALRGAYLAEFLEKVQIERGFAANPNLALNVRQMRHLWSGYSDRKFQSEIFDRVLSPQVREQLFERGEISDLVMRTIGRGEGSQTAGRTDQTAILNAVTDLVGSATGVLSEPGVLNRSLSTLLGFAGRLALSQGIINGRLANYLNRMATGVPLEANKIASAAITQGGGLGQVAQAIGSTVGGAAGDLMSGAQAVRDASSPSQQ